MTEPKSPGTRSGQFYLVITWTIAVFAIWSVAAIYGQLGEPKRLLQLPQSPVEVLSSWDGAHYRYLAEHGYSAQGEDMKLLNLFPLFPAVCNLLGGAKYAALAGILFNQLLLLCSMLLLSGLSPNGASEPLRKQPGFWLLISPFAFFLSTLYTESLFLFLSVLMVVAAQHKMYRTAFIAGFFAGLTRPTAICLPLLFVFDLVREKNRAWLLAVIAAPIVGIGLYLGGIAIATGDPLRYFKIHSGWANEWSLPFSPMFDALFWYRVNSLSFGVMEPVEIPAAVVSTVVIVTLLLIWGWRRATLKYVPFVLGSLLMIHAQSPFRSTARYELVLFPAFLMAAASFLSRRAIAPVAAATSVLMQLYLFLRFAEWNWVA